MNKQEQIQETIRSLKDEVLILSHPPGSVRRAIEIELIAERKRDEARKRAKKKFRTIDGLKVEIPQNHAVYQDDDAATLHLAKAAHGAAKAMHAMLPEHLRSQSGRPDWQRRGYTPEQVIAARRRRRGTREVYMGTDTSLRVVER